MCKILMASPSNIFALVMVGACAPVGLVPEQPQIVRRVPLPQLAREIGRHKGEIVQTCGTSFDERRLDDEPTGSWFLTIQDSQTPWQARVIVADCDGRPPPIENGCVTGRVAREDGSLAEPEWGVVTTHEIVNYEWWLHPQCPSS